MEFCFFSRLSIPNVFSPMSQDTINGIEESSAVIDKGVEHVFPAGAALKNVESDP
jgi:hypothetical protein